MAAGSDFFYKAFSSTLDECFELLAMPRELIMFRYHFEGNGTTAQWQELYRALNEEQKKELMAFVSNTVKEQLSDSAVQLSFMDDSDIVIEDE